MGRLAKPWLRATARGFDPLLFRKLLEVIVVQDR